MRRSMLSTFMISAFTGLASVQIAAWRDFVGRNERLDALADSDECTEVSGAEHRDDFDDRTGAILLKNDTPRVVPELLDAQADLLLVMVDREDDGFDIVALTEQVGRVVDLDGPRKVGLVDHAVDALFDAHEDTVIGNRTDLAGNLVTGLVLLGEERPGIGLELLETEADALGGASRPRAPGTRFRRRRS